MTHITDLGGLIRYNVWQEGYIKVEYRLRGKIGEQLRSDLDDIVFSFQDKLKLEVQ